MFKKILAALLAFVAAAAFAAVDANKATQAELETVKGIGPAISGKILDARKTGAFKDWQDMIDRVKGVGEKNAVKFSEAGLTVNGEAFKGAVAKADAKPAKAAKADKADKSAKAAKADAGATATAATTTAAAPAAEAASKPAKKSKKEKAEAAADAASKAAKK